MPTMRSSLRFRRPAPRKFSSRFLIACLICFVLVPLIFNILVVLKRLQTSASLKIELESKNQVHEEQSKTAQAKATVGYAISLIKCSDFQSSTAGMIDAALVMRHSIHQTSIRNPRSGSAYDYKMYALVHRQAEGCSQVFRDVGIEVLVVDPPLQPEDIKGEFLKARIHREWCCGHDEFIKLYAYTKIAHPIVVHVDIDFLFLQPMDELFDAILYDSKSKEGREARQRIPIETNFLQGPEMPDRIDAFFTKDWPQVIPGRKAAYQAGFVVLRPDKTVYEEIINVILEGNFTEGFSRENGWGGMGYGGFVGAMAMQGLMAYFYDVVRPRTAVEVNQCRYNWMGMDVKYNAAPNYQRRFHVTGRCRNNEEACEDCRFTDLSLIKNVHFTQCRKPWNCVGEGNKGVSSDMMKMGYIDLNAGDLQQCLKVVRKWHELRADFEDQFYKVSGDNLILSSRAGTYMPEVFMGHCNEIFQEGYNAIAAKPESFQKLAQMYS